MWIWSTVVVLLGAAGTEMRLCTSLIQSRWNLNGCAMDCTRSHWKTRVECLAHSIMWLLRVSQQPGETLVILLSSTMTNHTSGNFITIAKMPMCYSKAVMITSFVLFNAVQSFDDYSSREYCNVWGVHGKIYQCYTWFIIHICKQYELTCSQFRSTA